MNTKPNIILVSLDCVRADHLGCYGAGKGNSPFIDSIADDSILFTNAFAQSSWTPTSHASIFTGMDPCGHQIFDFGYKLDKRIWTMPGLLRRAGYEAHAFYSYDTLYAQFNMGVEYDTVTRLPAGFDPGLFNGLRPGRDPQFVFLHLGDAHLPYAPQEEYLGDSQAEMGIPERLAPLFKVRERPKRLSGINREPILGDGILYSLYLKFWEKILMPRWSLFRVIDGINKGEIRLSDEDVRLLRHRYDAGIRQVDDQLRQVHGILGENGFLEDAVVVITADHGEELYEHGKVHHACGLYNTLLHVPMILAAPGTDPNRISGQVSHVDILPTIMSLAGIEHGRLDGSDMLSAPNPPIHSRLRGLSSLIHDGWKLILHDDSFREQNLLRRISPLALSFDASPQLYNLADDPGEANNLYSGCMEKAIELEGMMDEHDPQKRSGSLEGTDMEITRRQLEGLGYI
ncbi:sulfatase [Candidatus Altiarchaeota archaeon]